MDRMWWKHWKWCCQEKNKKKWKIKNKLDKMWWWDWKWCRQEKYKKLENKKEKYIKCDGDIENGVVKIKLIKNRK